MFDISFSELLVIVVVALLVIGPEKLPKVARTLGAYAGRMQRFVAQVKDEVNREVRFEELQKLQQEVKSATLAAESSIMSGVGSIQQSVNEMVDASIPAKPAAKRIRKKIDDAAPATDVSKKQANMAKTKIATEKPKTTRTRKKAIE